MSAFVATREAQIESLNLRFQEYRHTRTGARHYHLATDDTNNAFLVAFLTVPQDSTGIAHILEHTSLCGSQRFPVRDPFFMMIRRSLNTFMNAFTAADWTAYPFASQNRKDFDNLLEVYLDATFFPLLDPLDFAQEGHRMEFSDPSDLNSPLEFKGVVYNEMKGAMSSPISQVAQTLQSELFPTITYHHNSGGEPSAIPDLTHEQLQAFHARHYHPSNAVFMTYGNFCPSEHQARFEDLALRHFEPLEMDLTIGDEARFDAPREVVGSFATDDDDTVRKSHVLFGWLLGPTTDLRASMRARLLSGVLLDNSASPLRHALETTSLGAAPSELCGLDDSMRDGTFVCGLEGCDADDAHLVEELVLSTLQHVADNGVSRDVVDAVLHQVELAQREVSGGGFPYGLQLMVRTLNPALYGADPIAALDLDPVLEELREEAANPDFIPSLVRELLLTNGHRVRLTMSPDPELATQNSATEQERLDAVRAALTEEARTALVQQAQALLERQNAEDDPSILPEVGIEDVPASLTIPTPAVVRDSPIKTTVYTPGTNGLAYVQVVAPMPVLDASLIDLLPLYCDFLPDVGCGTRDYLAIQNWQAAVTGGLRARTSMRANLDASSDPHCYFVVAAKALARNQDQMIELLRETFVNARFDELDRLRELVAQARLHAESQVTDAGHALAMMAASAGMSPCAALEHRWGGLAGLQDLKHLDKSLSDPAELRRLGDSLAAIRETIAAAPFEVFLVSEPGVADTLGDSFYRQWDTQLSAMGTDTPYENGISSALASFEPSAIAQAWTTNTQVNFCAQAFPAPLQGHPDAPALRVLGGFLRNGFLHRAIREQGGAYGSGAGYNPDAGAFRFFSYRDPRLGETLSDFGRSVDWFLNENHDDRLRKEAILGVIGEIDRPDSPAGEAVISYFGTLHGRSPEQRLAFREAVLGVTMDDLKRVAATYLSDVTPSTAVLTSTGAYASDDAVAHLDEQAI